MANSKKKDEDVGTETSEEKETEQPVDEAVADPEEAKSVHDDEDEDEDEDKKQYVTAGDLTATVAEIVKGIAEPVQALQTQISEMRVEMKKDLDGFRSELDALKQTEDARITEKAADTPAASLSAIIARTIVGNTDAKIDYHKDRELHQAGPDESEATHIMGAGFTGIPSIDAMIKEQRSGNRVTSAFNNGQ